MIKLRCKRRAGGEARVGAEAFKEDAPARRAGRALVVGVGTRRRSFDFPADDRRRRCGVGHRPDEDGRHAGAFSREGEAPRRRETAKPFAARREGDHGGEALLARRLFERPQEAFLVVRKSGDHAGGIDAEPFKAAREQRSFRAGFVSELEENDRAVARPCERQREGERRRALAPVLGADLVQRAFGEGEGGGARPVATALLPPPDAL